MKVSSATSGKAAATTDRQPTGQSSDRRPPSPISGREFALVGPSDLPDPALHAYRRDLADVALAGRVIASHFVDPVERRLVQPAAFRLEPSETSDVLEELEAGECFQMLDCKLGWAWGYAGAPLRVGYVKDEALGLA